MTVSSSHSQFTHVISTAARQRGSAGRSIGRVDPDILSPHSIMRRAKSMRKSNFSPSRPTTPSTSPAKAVAALASSARIASTPTQRRAGFRVVSGFCGPVHRLSPTRLRIRQSEPNAPCCPSPQVLGPHLVLRFAGMNRMGMMRQRQVS